METRCGAGRVLHFGGTFARENVKAFLKATGALSPWDGLLSLSEDCELAVREKHGRRFIFVLNYQKETQTITLNQEMTDVDDGSRVRGEVTLAAYETKVYRL